MNDSTTIHARIHDSALRRVTRTFSATLADIFTETLQNARRAGATRVRVVLGEPEPDGGTAVIVLDDGAGIADPSVLLSFGENGWDGDLVAREDAAGMGMLSLARGGCAVSSRPRAPGDAPAPGWRVELEPAHFLGDAGAEIRPEIGAPVPHGTAVRFRALPTESAETIRRALEAAALHYPLPVLWGHVAQSPRDAEALPRRAFLDGAVYAERWRGLAFGVFRNRRPHPGLHEPDANFHGLTLNLRLPSADSVHGVHFTVAADVEDCPDLELVLPARKEAVETPFLEDLREAARFAIYRAMAADPDPRPAFEDWRNAADAGIEISPPPTELRPWRPAVADIDNSREVPNPATVCGDALVVHCDPEPPEAHALWRAAGRAGMADRLFEPDRRLEGYAWYDALPRIAALCTEVTADGRTRALDAQEAPERTGAPKAPLPERPDAIRIRLAVRAPAGAGDSIDLPADVAFAGEAWCWVGDALPLVTADSNVDPLELSELLRDAFFCPSDDAGADSWERQRADFEAESLHIATRLLISDDEARRRSIADAIERDLFWLIPRDRGVDIAVRGGRVAVTLGEPAAGDAP